MLAEVVTRAECYIKGEERNAQKKVCNVKEHTPGVESSHHPRKNNYTSPMKDKSTFKRVGKVAKSFTL